MAGRGSWTAAWQDEIFERRQRLVERIEFFLETLGVLSFDQAHAGDAQFATEIEQVVLYAGETFADVSGKVRNSQNHADRAVSLVYRAVRLDASVVLGDARAVTEACRAVIAGLRIDLAQAVSHGV